ncbi:MAG: cation diffusion facilitator family transporter [Clostridia bacterium]|nr:cation diffusion facilitator family transporter [Clostridia bacterium]
MEDMNAERTAGVRSEVIGGAEREKIIIRTSVIGIAGNTLLAGFKAVIGVLSGSIAITLDAVNNLSDALGSVITIVGTKLARKKPDKKHPLGHGRIEYLSAMVISLLVLYAGFTSLVESVKKIMDPVVPEYSTTGLVIITVAVLVKIVIGRYFRTVGERVNSDSLINSGQDATLDSVISASTLVAAVIFIEKGISLEAWLGAIISLVIIKAGIDMLRETISRILGERPDSDISKGIKATVCSFPEVLGAYDLVLHNYGPDLQIGSIHMEIPDTMTADEIDSLTRKVEQKVLVENHVILAAVGIYSVNTKNDHIAMLREDIRHIVMSSDYVLQMHGFHINEENKEIAFDMVISYSVPDRNAEHERILEMLREKYPDHRFNITLDNDLSD